MKLATTITRWATVAVLLLPVIFFFAPYRALYDEKLSGFGIIRMFFGLDDSLGSIGSASKAEAILRFVVPVCFVFIAGIIFLIRANIGTAITAAILSALAFFFYQAYIGDYLNDSYGIEFGLLVNYILSLVGIILPIVAIVLKKINQAQEKKASEIVSSDSNQQ